MCSFGPVKKEERLLVVDSLRGLALLGILLANIPFAEGLGHGLDNALKVLTHLFIDKKFITIFSILFGFGFAVQLRKAGEAGINFKPYFTKRMLVLLLIGCMHAYLFWFGDIIRDYAICGLILLIVCHWPAKKILVAGSIVTVILTALVFITNGALGIPDYNYDRAIINEHPVTDSYWRYLQVNATVDPFVNFSQDSPITLVFCFGNMLIGLSMGKMGFFREYSKFRTARKILMLTGAPIGILCSYLLWQIMSGELEVTAGLIWLPVVVVAGLLLQSLFYISLFITLFDKNKWKPWLSAFAPVGKMALTNYLLQTAFYVLLFFHWTNGPGLYGKLTVAQTYLVALGLFGLQVLYSSWWMLRYEQGPVEWLWKRLSYGTEVKKPAHAAQSVLSHQSTK
jgi:uncharacterized protein